MGGGIDFYSIIESEVEKFVLKCPERNNNKLLSTSKAKKLSAYIKETLFTDLDPKKLQTFERIDDIVTYIMECIGKD